MSSNMPKVAYFCMEYGLDESFKIYSGGLGILAGDHLKGARDNNLPLVGIGIKWKQGYVEQIVSQGKLYDGYRQYDYDFLEDTGVKVKVRIRQNDVYCKVWRVDCFGNAPLYLLDTDLEENNQRWITGQLYGGFSEDRIAQEMILGIGGVKALRALGINVDVYHFNEGHAALAGLELIREKMDKGYSFKEAWDKTRNEVVFTTHTPIKAGNEHHSIETLLYMGANLNFSVEELNEIGGVPFNMTVAALRMSRKANAVAALHNETANKMWRDIKEKASIIGITNGIHKGTWVDDRMRKEFNSLEEMWNNHMEIKRELIAFVEEKTGKRLKEKALLIGFSRRAAAYKRSDLIFKDEKMLEDYLQSGDVQIIFSGKAHPLDDSGKKIVLNLVEMSKKYPNSVVFIENYDIEIGKMLTRGCDVWLNNPRRPNEASGTSGMKAAMNGVLNCSTLDGWWPEVCQHGVNGWVIGDETVSQVKEEQDDKDAKALYEVLLTEVIPTYYKKPQKWLKMMDASIKTTSQYFSVDRMLQEYYDLMYKQE
ncbi:alpha-glucan family phosphorylase [Alkaliphilus pronyensis]|uniref:glycogen phosphorylase n=1 Tax=Alkaliphilus pronyensis TaxID=1482732 RepID=A0A6I0F9X5_9FIRM|nr:alpha-glucan family phosphorylase [Alkaliphilus pronyensis]KAB3534098.1 alpha-glucan family phosphorylase [Alkaliphilus pronyensis]